MIIHRRSIGLFLAVFAALGLVVSLNVQYSLDLGGAPHTVPVSGGMHP